MTALYIPKAAPTAQQVSLPDLLPQLSTIFSAVIIVVFNYILKIRS